MTNQIINGKKRGNMALPIKLEQKYSYADYLIWDSDERWEIINGEVYNMSPAPSRIHQEISGKIYRQISESIENKGCKAYYAPFDVRFAEKKQKNDSIFNVVQPDIVVVCDNEKLDDKGCIGCPDIIIEIISPTSAVRDAKDKFVLYEKQGVKEYWIVYPEEKMIMIFNLNKNKEYGKPKIYSSKDVIETDILPGLKVELARVFED